MERIETPYNEIDFHTILDIGIANVKIVEEKLFGPVYTRFVKKFALEFAAKKLGDTLPEGSEEWDLSQVKNYLKSNIEQYPHIFGALMYGMARAEAYLAGSSGVVRRITVNEMAKAMNKKLESINKQGNTRQDISSIDIGSEFKQVVNKLTIFKTMPPGASYSVMDASTVKMEVDNCPYSEVCKAFHTEKVVTYSRAHVCSIATMICAYLALGIPSGSDYDYDYNLDEFTNTKCKVRIMLKER